MESYSDRGGMLMFGRGENGKEKSKIRGGKTKGKAKGSL